ncbi:MAG: Lrp/AsnC ligand binding domain-containing protein [Candidatus Aminicenantes bacterium]|nr:Lrp/AsnC ligand binding domain-containing protein [Candidatus Aminicenantes bacterium]
MNYEIDNLDRQILSILQKDARRSFQLIAKDLIVSGGTIHIRFNKLKETGVIKGSQIRIDPEKMGYEVCAFVGINLHNARDYKTVIRQLNNIPEILEAHYTTGKYNIFLKVVATSTRGLHNFLIERLQNIPQIQSTETLISLEMPIKRDIPIEFEEECE